jgi:putative inorganic carbon (HCO3(-)) transporter
MSPQNSTWVHWSRQIVNYELLILLLLLPSELFPSPFQIAPLLIIPLLWLLHKVAYGRFAGPTPFDVAILALLLMLLVSQFATFDIQFSLGKTTGLLYGIAVFYAAAAASGRSWRHMAAGTGILIISGLTVATFALVGTNWIPKFPVLREITALLPQFVFFPAAAPEGFSPNPVAGTLLWVLPVFIVVATISYKELDRWQARLGRRPATVILALSLAALIFMTGIFLLTQSRGGWAGLAVAMLFLFLVFRGKRWYVMLAVSLIFALLVMGAIWWLVGDETPPEPGWAGEEALEIPGTASLQNSLELRLEIWNRALYGIQDYPLTGMGMGTFRRVAPVLYPLLLTPFDKDIAHAHNHLLQTALDLGLPGLAAYLALWLLAGILLWQVWRTAGTERARYLAVGFAAGLLGYFVYGLTDTIALGAKPGSIFWLLLGLVAGLHRLAEVRGRAASAPSPHRSHGSSATTIGS